VDPNLTQLAGLAIVMIAGIAALKPVLGAFAERIRRGTEQARDGQQELAEEVRAMRQELAELAERVDFTERLLAKGSEASRVNVREG
jgi:F0F1-type ATP synthase membrane subunit b/b'